MSTTSTLFRFITMRAPELVSDTVKQRQFIKHPNPAGEGHFREQLASPAGRPAEQMAALRSQASLLLSWRTVDTVKKFLGSGFVEFANWLAKNRQSVAGNPTVIKATYPQYREMAALSHDQVIAIWNNLFYQVIKNESPAIREQLIQALAANHFIQAAAWGEIEQFQAVMAKVVLPKELFVVAEPSSNENNGPVYTKPLQKALDTALAKDKATILHTAIEDLKKVQAGYEKTTQAAYKSARTAHDRTVAEIIRSNTIIVDETTGESRINPSVTLPEFEFQTEQEITAARLNQLPAPSLYAAQQLGLSSLTTFAEALEVLNKEANVQAVTAVEGETLRRSLININNIILPVEDDLVLPGQLYSFLAKPVAMGTDLYKIYISVNMGQPDTDAIEASYAAQWLSNNISHTAFTDRASGNNLVLQLFPAGITIPSNIPSFQLTGQVTLSNGNRLSFSANVPVATGATGRMLPVIEIEPEDNATGTELYIPSGFGLKRLGIADYRRVEQTTCCYVPGEVSHIENVMAREYKEKSNRRLRRSEETVTTETSTEKEQLTDTTSTDRYEMQQQVSSVISNDMSAGVNVSSNFEFGKNSITIGSNFAYNTSQQQSNSQALNYAKDVTTRALERVVQRVREERISKIIEEYEEQNKHGFDNRTGDSHVSGVYRWVDKIYKNQVFNYGKRLMYEFMIPQPAVFHKAAMKSLPDTTSATVLSKPVDPRSADLKDSRSVNENNFAVWAAAYNAEVEAPPQEYMYIGKSFTFEATITKTEIEYTAKDSEIAIPDGYYTTDAKVQIAAMDNLDTKPVKRVCVKVGDADFGGNSVGWPLDYKSNYIGISRFTGKIPVSVAQSNYYTGNVNISVKVQRLPEHYRQWQLDTFKAIIEAYEKKLAEYNESANTTGATETNPLFYRQIENTILRKNCISYLVGHHNLGKKFYSGSKVTDLQPDLTSEMDQYAGLVKFIEQAFEWEILSYNFYPFYWGDNNKWQEVYQQDVSDPLFRAFLQSGMARAVVTVRPGFEEAVMHYMATGQVWNGGEVPVVGDDLYLSIVEELKNPTYYVEETWETRVPTTLTVIQSGSIGLNAQGLPCDCGEGNTGIVQTNDKLGVTPPTQPSGD